MEIDIKVLENPTMIGRIVTRVGLLSVTVRFKKPYRWGHASPKANMETSSKFASLPHQIFSSHTLIPDLGIQKRNQSFPFTILVWQTHGEQVSQPTVLLTSDHQVRITGTLSLGIQGGTIVMQFFILVLLTRFGWSLQMEDYGDVRLSATYGKKGSKFRMKWPASVLFITSLLRLELFAELWECLMTGTNILDSFFYISRAPFSIHTRQFSSIST